MQSVEPVAFTRLTGDYWQLWVMRPDGTGVKQLTTLLSDKRYPCWTQDGKHLLFRNNNNQAFILDPSTKEEQRILPSLGLIGSVVESPDGAKVLFVRFRTELMDSSALWMTTIDEKERRVLTNEAGLQYDPAWSPDGKRIVYISGHGYQTHELFIMDSDGKNKRQLTDNKALELLPVFSSDGRTIAYVSDITGDYEIWTMDVDGNNQQQLTNSNGIDTRPCWSPDGSRIIFVSNRSGEPQLWIMNRDGSNVRQLTTGQPCMDPAWKRETGR